MTFVTARLPVVREISRLMVPIAPEVGLSLERTGVLFRVVDRPHVE